jgi:SAM-dependent methyltransferase
MRITRDEAARAADTMPPDSFRRMDESADELFYGPARLVTHIDDGAIAAVTDLYRRYFPPGGAILDLMGSWVSHLPDEIAYGRVAGHGMNADELAANSRYDDRVVQNLNLDPVLPYADRTFDGAGCCVSVQYLTRPFEVFAEVARVLKPGAPFVVTFSNRCFPTKAVFIWQSVDGSRQAQLVGHYMAKTGFEDIALLVPRPDGGTGDPLRAVVGRAPD